MGAEMPVASGAWTTLGRVLDTERDRIFGAFVSKCLSNVGPASARGSARPGCQHEQDFPKNMMRRLVLVLLATLASISSVYAQSATPAGIAAPLKAIYT